MKKFYLLTIIFLFSVYDTAFVNAQEQKDDLSKYFESIEQFNRVADHRSETLIFKLLQFNAPYRGGYYETSLSNNGKIYAARVTPFAIQNSRRANLSKSQINEIKRKLSNFFSQNITQSAQPQDEQLYSALVFNDNQKFSRYNFIGQIPNELQEIIDFLKVEFEKSEKQEYEAFLEQGKLLKEKYGDWQEKTELLHTSRGFGKLENNNAVLLYLSGLRQPIKDNRPPEIPIYYSLVFYPEGRIIGGAVGRRGRSDNPISSSGIKWALPKKGDESNETEKEFLITYDAINGTITIKKSIYQLTRGNLFVIKMDDDWRPKVSQLDVYLDKPTDKQTVMERFRKELGDETLQLPQQ